MPNAFEPAENMKREDKNNSQVKVFPVDVQEIKTLLKVFSSINEAILSKVSTTQYGQNEKVFSTSNIVGEFAEILVCERLDYTQNIASKSDYDCVDANGKKVQIKSRLLKSGRKNGNDRMGDISVSALSKIDYVIAILFDENFEVKYAFKIAKGSYQNYAPLSKKGYRLSLNSHTISSLQQGMGTDVEDIKDALNGKQMPITNGAKCQNGIGQYAKKTFEHLIADGKLSSAMLGNLMDVNYCKITFKTQYAVLVEKGTSYPKARYYASSKSSLNYCITNAWYEANRQYLDAWLINNKLN